MPSNFPFSCRVGFLLLGNSEKGQPFDVWEWWLVLDSAFFLFRTVLHLAGIEWKHLDEVVSGENAIPSCYYLLCQLTLTFIYFDNYSKSQIVGLRLGDRTGHSRVTILFCFFQSTSSSHADRVHCHLGSRSRQQTGGSQRWNHAFTQNIDVFHRVYHAFDNV